MKENEYIPTRSKIESELAEQTKQMQLDAIAKYPGTQAVLEERRRQIFCLGYNAEHDRAEHSPFGFVDFSPKGDSLRQVVPLGLVEAAAAYCMWAAGHEDEAVEFYPWGDTFSPKGDRLRQVVKAAALLLASLDLLSDEFDIINAKLKEPIKNEEQ